MGSIRSYTLLVRQHPERARICSFKDKSGSQLHLSSSKPKSLTRSTPVDRRPIDPPPIVQLVSPDGREAESHANGNLFIMVKLVDPKTGDEIRADTGAKCTAGTTIQVRVYAPTIAHELRLGSSSRVRIGCATSTAA